MKMLKARHELKNKINFIANDHFLRSLGLLITSIMPFPFLNMFLLFSLSLPFMLLGSTSVVCLDSRDPHNNQTGTIRE